MLNSGMLANKVVLITGAARGIGRACALRAAQEGADLVISDVCDDIEHVPYRLGTSLQLETAAAQCKAWGAAVLQVRADVRSVEQTSDMVARAVQRFGKIDALINNAGIGAPAGKLAHEYSEEEWSLVLDVNLNGALRMLRAVVPWMIRQRAGCIVNIASTAGQVGYKRFGAYVASKHALIGLTKVAALDYASMNIRVNAICPGPVSDDPTVEGFMTNVVASSLGISLEEQEAIDRQSVVLDSVADPADVAGAVMWLLSDDARKVTGSSTVVDAGFTIR